MLDVKKIGVLISNPQIIIKSIEGKDFKLDISKMKKLYDATIPNLMEI